jgi:hypothetical protein
MDIVAAFIGFAGVVVGAIGQYFLQPILAKLLNRKKDTAEVSLTQVQTEQLRQQLQLDVISAAREAVKDKLAEIGELEKKIGNERREYLGREAQLLERVAKLEKNNVEYMRLVTERDTIILTQQKTIEKLQRDLDEAQGMVRQFKHMIDTGELRYSRIKIKK